MVTKPSEEFWNLYKQIDLVGFDIDGTIIDNRKHLYNNLKDKFQCNENWLSNKQTQLLTINAFSKNIFDKFIKLIYFIIFPISQITKNFKFLIYYRKIKWKSNYAEKSIETHPVLQIIELINMIKIDKSIFIATNQYTDDFQILLPKLSEMGFESVISSHDIGFHKPHSNFTKAIQNKINNLNFIYVGDSWEDLMMCHEGNIPFILGNTGFWTTKALIEFKKQLIQHTKANPPMWLLSDITKIMKARIN